MKKDVVSLDDLLNRISGYVSAKGAEYPVTAANAIEFSLIERVDKNDPDVTMAECVALAKKLCPALPEDVWLEGDTNIVGIIFMQSCKKIRRVEEELPLSSGSATTSAAPTVESHAP